MATRVDMCDGRLFAQAVLTNPGQWCPLWRCPRAWARSHRPTTYLRVPNTMI